MSIPTFSAGSRLMLIAPHPDDEALAGGIILQRAASAGAALRVVYATDGDDNPWPQRVLERKWHLNAADRKRWGKLRRVEALAALRVLGVNAFAARFLALADQKLTHLLMHHCRSTIEKIGAIISEWAPTHLLVPSLADTHPDHNALGVMLRLVVAEFFPDELGMSIWSYAVHGRSSAFFQAAQTIPQSETERAIKLRAILCHKSQIKLSRDRFLSYAARPERLLKVGAQEETVVNGPMRSILRQPCSLQIKFELSVKPMRRAEPALFVLGQDKSGTLRCASMQLPVRSSRIEIFDSVTRRRLGVARYRGNAFAGELAIPTNVFSSAHVLFVKLERRSWFFDEAGWFEVPSTAHSEQVAAAKRDALEELSSAVR